MDGRGERPGGEGNRRMKEKKRGKGKRKKYKMKKRRSELCLLKMGEEMV
jgi:hypothetical protein